MCVGHVMQGAHATMLLYFPASQASQEFSAAFLPYPLLHVQFGRITLPAFEIEPAGHEIHVDLLVAANELENVFRGHSEHADDPLTSLYCPLVHALHIPPSGPLYPALQMQPVLEPLPGSEEVSAGQPRQVLSLV